MSARRRGGNSQPELFPRSKRPAISLSSNHPMVVLTDTVDWTEMELQVEKVRAKKLKNAAGRPPNLRATLGAPTLMAIRKMPYREAEEQIRYCAPARYLCGLTKTDWTPDFTTIQDFAQLLGEDGCRLINEAVVKQAVALGLADPKVAVADMTAQEVAIPHPNEMGLLGGFVKSIAAAAKRMGQGFQSFLGKVHGKLRAAKEHVRKYRLFAKGKTKAAEDRMVAQMTKIIEGINQNLGEAITAASAQGRRLRGHAVVAQRKLVELHATMGKLIPQIRHWLRTGFVAAGKIINLHIPQSTRSCAAKWASRSSSVCRGESPDCAAASCLRPWPGRKPSSPIPAMQCAQSKISQHFGA